MLHDHVLNKLDASYSFRHFVPVFGLCLVLITNRMYYMLFGLMSLNLKLCLVSVLCDQKLR